MPRPQDVQSDTLRKRPRPDYVIKRGDSGLDIRVTLQDDDGPFTIPSDASVRFRVKSMFAGTVIVDGLAFVVSGTPGMVGYTWVDADTQVAGDYEAEWIVHLASGSQVTFPSDDFVYIRITDDV